MIGSSNVARCLHAEIGAYCSSQLTPFQAMYESKPKTIRAGREEERLDKFWSRPNPEIIYNYDA